MRRHVLRGSAVLLVACCAAAEQPADDAARLPPSAERAYRALSRRFDRAGAADIVAFMDRFWRIAGNPGYDASIDHIRERLAAAGFTDGGQAESDLPTGTDARVRVEEFANPNRGWDHQVATMTFADDPAAPPIFSRERDRVALCINSFSTPAGGLVAPLVDVHGGTAADFEGKPVAGAIVLGDAPVGRLWQQAVRLRGAKGVISTEIATYLRPADPAQFTSEQQEDVFQWGGIPYDEAARSFGFKASWRAAERLRERLLKGAVSLRVSIESTFYDRPNRSLVAELRGSRRPGERIVLVAHVQEPGANDNASGSATLYAIARAILSSIRDGAIPPPSRTLTFMWVDEIRGSREWVRSHAEDARGVKYMFALDMTGEDVAKTGGSFLVEKQADPSAVWDRPSDPHTDWGKSRVKAESLKGSLLNDVVIAACRRRARETGGQWTVRTNPYEGGSDHTVFADAGIPALLTWHFTDRYYHTNQDRPDKVSAAEMENVGVSVATSAWFLASARAADAEATVELIERAAQRRLALELQQRADAPIVDAWERWYGEALETVLALASEPPSSSLRQRVSAAQDRLVESSKKRPR